MSCVLRYYTRWGDSGCYSHSLWHYLGMLDDCTDLALKEGIWLVGDMKWNQLILLMNTGLHVSLQSVWFERAVRSWSTENSLITLSFYPQNLRAPAIALLSLKQHRKVVDMRPESFLLDSSNCGRRGSSLVVQPPQILSTGNPISPASLAALSGPSITWSKQMYLPNAVWFIASYTLTCASASLMTSTVANSPFTYISGAPAVFAPRETHRSMSHSKEVLLGRNARHFVRLLYL